MSRQEVIANIGTIAKSGTRELLQTIRIQVVRDCNLADRQLGLVFYPLSWLPIASRS
jgi:HSP90 family molecular chaperone